MVRVEFTIQLAWALRGSDWAKNTTGEQFAGFFQVLPQAVERIERAAELNPATRPRTSARQPSPAA